jgi:acyl-CoA dehydrogenase
MNESNDFLIQPFQRLLKDICPPSVVRQEEARAGVASLWNDIEASGFLDALVPEESGGAGQTLNDIFPLLLLCGAFALPAPVGETMIARAVLVRRGVTPPADGAIIIAPPSPVTPLAAKANYALVPRENVLVLLAIEPLQLDPFRAGGCAGPVTGKTVLEVPTLGFDLLSCAAALTAANMAGAMGHLVGLATAYANDRMQFGRPLSKFQAIQHQLAVAAQETVAAQCAARIGFSGKQFDPLRCAVSKARVGKSSEALCAIIHAVHGAIGVTEEYDLQLYTRRLKQGQLAFGSQSYWTKALGLARTNALTGTSADFVRLNLQEDFDHD